MRSSFAWKELGLEPLLLHIERSQLQWLGHLGGVPLKGRPEVDPGHDGETISLGWPGSTSEHLLPEELEEESEDKEVWASLFMLLRNVDPSNLCLQMLYQLQSTGFKKKVLCCLIKTDKQSEPLGCKCGPGLKGIL